MKGISSDEATLRLARDGRNELAAAPRRSLPRRFADQFASVLVVLLLAATAVALAMREWLDAAAIAGVVVINAVVGLIQEGRAERALAALRSLTTPRARVLRDGRSAIVPAAEVVQGDLLLLAAGDIVAADARLIEAHDLACDEAALTGESLPVEKRVDEASLQAPLAERCGRVHAGSPVTTGSGAALVEATGMATELGRIASLLANAPEKTPLQIQLDRVGRQLVVFCLVAVSLVLAMGLLRGEPPLQVLLTAISLAVAAVPEGLPAVVTIALALGVQRLAAQHVLVRRLPSVETLGSVTVVCTDKTGTLTTGRMAVVALWADDERRLLEVAAACCDAEWDRLTRTGTGDPTEIAILERAAGAGVFRERIEQANPRRRVVPFGASHRTMTIERADGRLYVKGAFESVVERCAGEPQGVREAHDQLAARGLRVLAVATGPSTAGAPLEFVGIVALADPPRPGAAAALKKAHAAGLRVVMLTGDHPVTAHRIAEQLGLAPPGTPLASVVRARVTAEEKLAIVREVKANGEIVAMTGDGVNDAPALKEAHIGIAMGRTGSEVTREAADMVLTDDAFETILAAVREGRGIFEGLRTTLVYLLTTNVTELLVMLVAGFASLPAPLLPLHLLWVNLVTELLPSLALVTQPAPESILSAPPRPPDVPMLDAPRRKRILATALCEAVLVLGLFVTYRGEGLDKARSVAVTLLVTSVVLRALASGLQTSDGRRTVRPALVAVVLGTLVLQLLILGSAPARRLFHFTPLTTGETALLLAVALIPALFVTLLGRRSPRA